MSDDTLAAPAANPAKTNVELFDRLSAIENALDEGPLEGEPIASYLRRLGGHVREIALVHIEMIRHPADRQAEESNLVQHARRELALCAETDEPFKASLLAAVQGFASYGGHSGGSAMIAMDMLGRLLRFENLSPLTDAPDEWIDRTEMSGGHPMWQSTRNSAAFSEDGGKTYYLLGEPLEGGSRVMHTSAPAGAGQQEVSV